MCNRWVGKRIPGTEVGVKSLTHLLRPDAGVPSVQTYALADGTDPRIYQYRDAEGMNLTTKGYFFLRLV